MSPRHRGTAGQAAPPTPAARPRVATEELRQTLAHMSAAERRLRSRDHARPGELSHAQLRSIAALGRQPEMTVGQLAQSAELTPATVTVMLDQLEAAGIVVRHRSTEDRRVCNVSLTDKGWELLEAKLGTWRGLWEERLAAVSDEELNAAIRVIRRVTELYDATATPREGEKSPPGGPPPAPAGPDA